MSALVCFPSLFPSLHLVVSFIYNVYLCRTEAAEVTEMQSSDLGSYFWLVLPATPPALQNDPAVSKQLSCLPRARVDADSLSHSFWLSPPQRCCQTTVLDPSFRLSFIFFQVPRRGGGGTSILSFSAICSINYILVVSNSVFFPLLIISRTPGSETFSHLDRGVETS